MSRTAQLLKPRIVIVTRKTPLELLIDRHGTHAQARFYLESRGQDIGNFEEAHERFESGFAQVIGALPPDRRRTRVDRDGLDRFLFSPDDVVVMVGQDGLVPNTAKYLEGQLAVGINPDPERYDGILCPHPPASMPALLDWLERREGPPYRIQPRIMAAAEREDGQRLLSLNEVYVGHRTHQSAKYRIRAGDREERHSSSGLICATGTGATGWARSIATQRQIAEPLPKPEEARLAWFVREPWPSVATGIELNFGFVEEDRVLQIVSEMGEEGVIFADGIESDRIEFVTGQSVRIGIAPRRLNLVVAA
jgi:NAD kinase